MSGGKASRSRGKRGEQRARDLLTERDYEVHDLTDGTACADFLAIHAGKVWSVEVKNHKSINIPAFCGQARKQAGSKRWMVLAHIEGYASWLVLSSGMPPVVWHEK